MAKQVSRELYRLLEGQKSIVLYKSAKRLQRVKRTHAYIYINEYIYIYIYIYVSFVMPFYTNANVSSFYQDRLGTNLGKAALRKRGLVALVFFTGLAHPPVQGDHRDEHPKIRRPTGANKTKQNAPPPPAFSFKLVASWHEELARQARDKRKAQQNQL
jgi:hypothetical protein